MNSKIENLFCNLGAGKMLRRDPHRPKERIDKLDPRCEKLSTDEDEPSRAIARTLRVELSLAVSRSENDEPNLT
jgi:hypothetical protein